MSAFLFLMTVEALPWCMTMTTMGQGIRRSMLLYYPNHKLLYNAVFIGLHLVGRYKEPHRFVAGQPSQMTGCKLRSY